MNSFTRAAFAPGVSVTGMIRSIMANDQGVLLWAERAKLVGGTYLRLGFLKKASKLGEKTGRAAPAASSLKTSRRCMFSPWTSWSPVNAYSTDAPKGTRVSTWMASADQHTTARDRYPAWIVAVRPRKLLQNSR